MRNYSNYNTPPSQQQSDKRFCGSGMLFRPDNPNIPMHWYSLYLSISEEVRPYVKKHSNGLFYLPVELAEKKEPKPNSATHYLTVNDYQSDYEPPYDIPFCGTGKDFVFDNGGFIVKLNIFFNKLVNQLLMKNDRNHDCIKLTMLPKGINKKEEIFYVVYPDIYGCQKLKEAQQNPQQQQQPQQQNPQQQQRQPQQQTRQPQGGYRQYQSQPEPANQQYQPPANQHPPFPVDEPPEMDDDIPF